MNKEICAKKQRRENHQDETRPCQISLPLRAINELPVEILGLILRQIGTIQDIVVLQAVCKRWRDVICALRLNGQDVDLDYLLIDDKERLLTLQGLILSGLGSGGVSTSLNIAMLSLRSSVPTFQMSSRHSYTLKMLHSQLYKNLAKHNDTQMHTIAEVGNSELQRFKTAGIESDRLARCWMELTKVQRQQQRWWTSYFAQSLPGPEDDPVFIVGSEARAFSRYTVLRQLCRKSTLQLNVMMRDVLLFLYYLSSVNNPVRTLQLTSTPGSSLPFAQLLKKMNKMVLGHIVNLELDNVQLNYGGLKEFPHFQFPNLRTLKFIRGTVDFVLLHSISRSLVTLELPQRHKMNKGVLRAISGLSNLKVLLIDHDLLDFSRFLSTCGSSRQFPCPSLEELTFYRRGHSPFREYLTMPDFLARLVELFSKRMRMPPVHCMQTKQKVQQTKAAVHLRKLDAAIYAKRWEKKDWNESFERCLVLFPHLSGPIRYRAKNKKTARFFDAKTSAIAEKEIKDYFKEI